MILKLTGLFLAFFLANKYVHAQGLPGLVDGGKVGEVYRDVHELAKCHIRDEDASKDTDPTSFKLCANSNNVRFK
jgi:hypothetical protein